MASLPFSLIGVFLGLLLTGTTLNIFSIIGFLMLMGLVQERDFAGRSSCRSFTAISTISRSGAKRSALRAA